MALALVALLLPFAVIFAYVMIDPEFSKTANAYVFDLPLAALIVLTLPELARGIRRRTLGAGAGLWGALLAVMLFALAVHPSLEGVHTVYRVAGALAVAITFASLEGRERSLVIGALGLAALTQSAWAVAQVVHGAPLGAWWLFEDPEGLQKAGGAWLPRGTMQTAYLLPTLALVASLVAARHAVRSRAIAWCAAIAALVVPVGLTYSRTALAALMAGLAALAPRARADLARRIVIAALVAGFVVPAALTSSGWLARGAQFGEERPDSGRGVLLLQGVVLLSMEPLTGVGPGRYLTAARTLTDDPGVQQVMRVTHMVPLIAAAESGVVAGAIVLVLLGALLVRALRDRDDTAVALYLVLLPFWIVDHSPYSLPQGLLITGVWLGALDAAHRDVA